MGYKAVRIMDMVNLVGEDVVKEILSDFSCEYTPGQSNDEVENFLHKNAIEFSKRKMSITYLVMDDDVNLVGYFTLTHKPIVVFDKTLASKTAKKKMSFHAKYDDSLATYSVSAFLIAQFSKNYSIPPSERISGRELMALVLSLIEDIQRQIGGGIVFLECEDRPQLYDFYTKPPNSFFQFGERYSEKDETKYLQMMRFI